MSNKKVLQNEKGFTLIEIIAVIIIMGILAAVAVPKFFSMQEDAKIAALNGALSEGSARFNLAYSRFILDHKRAPTTIEELTSAPPVLSDGTTPDYLGATGATTGTDIGDFTIAWTKTGAAQLTIEVKKMDTITDATLAAMDLQYRQKVIDGVNWGS